MLRIDDSFNNEAYSSLFMQLSKYIKIPNEIDVKMIEFRYKKIIRQKSKIILLEVSMLIWL